MKRLILTGSSGIELFRAGRADLVISFSFRFAWQLPPDGEIATYLGPLPNEGARGFHWSAYAAKWTRDARQRQDLPLVEFCRDYDVIELWFDQDPNDQLQLIWLLDFLRSDPEIVDKLRLMLIEFELWFPRSEALQKAKIPSVAVTATELETASSAWQAYRAPTPERCVDLLSRDLSAVPLLRPALWALINELPSTVSGLGATEMRCLEMLARGCQLTNALFHLRTFRGTRVYHEFEIGWLLHGLAFGPRPAIAGLDDELRAMQEYRLGDRQVAYQRSRLSLTDFGKAVVAGKEDFSRHNPIDRWWGGTHLTSDNLWRLNPVLVQPREARG